LERTLSGVDIPDAAGTAQGQAEVRIPDMRDAKSMRPRFTVVLSGDLNKLGNFVRAEVLDGDIRGRQEVFYR